MSGQREHGMLFSGPMVRALLREQAPKTVTRQLITPHSAYFSSAPPLFWKHAAVGRAWVDGKGSPEEYLHVPCHRGDALELRRLDAVWAAKEQEHGYSEQYPDCGPCEVCDGQGWRMTSHRLWSRIKPGDRIWVRETWVAIDNEGIIRHKPSATQGLSILYAADDNTQHSERGFSWKSSIHMPRWASRLTLEVLSVRAERLQDITEEDAEREGMVYTEHPPLRGASMSIDGGKTFHSYTTPRGGWAAEPDASPDHVLGSARLAFANLWNKINPRSPWESNPLVWRYELRRSAS